MYEGRKSAHISRLVQTLAIVLTYQPRFDTLRDVLSAVLQQVQHVLIVDNGSTNWPENLAPDIPQHFARNLTVLRMPENLGVGAGHNRGVQWARAHGYSHVLILDQDSVPAPDMVSRLMRSLEMLEHSGSKVACVGPRYVDRQSGHRSRFVRFGNLTLSRVSLQEEARSSVVAADFVISSGALIPLAVLDDVGLMDEGLFVDHVDTEWILRARYRGYRTFGVPDAFMQHSLGEASVRFWLGRWRYLPDYPPERNYYVFRNSLVLYQRCYAPRAWIINDAIRLFVLALFYPLCLQPRLARVKLIARGIADGIRGRQGKIVTTGCSPCQSAMDRVRHEPCTRSTPVRKPPATERDASPG